MSPGSKAGAFCIFVRARIIAHRGTGRPQARFGVSLISFLDRHLPYRRFQWPVGNVGASWGWGILVYVVRAIHVDGVTGTFTAEKNTRREALELAKSLREQGLCVIIFGPDGKPVDETENQ